MTSEKGGFPMFECADHAGQTLLSEADMQDLRFLITICTKYSSPFYHSADKICVICGSNTQS
jgi:hypothetical protein